MPSWKSPAFPPEVLARILAFTVLPSTPNQDWNPSVDALDQAEQARRYLRVSEKRDLVRASTSTLRNCILSSRSLAGQSVSSRMEFNF